ncbi:hypothetical protein L226DRAFT_349109 [Lentinus tigrinus ALCF2SS1-7]|uniref:uncharacterized protein n=1 Tax=Lentinus tigrinus ALCF2SS1-7 TaxID=1328758 RepID=UPI00116636A8|nr:hypothetical protein L226DRAFT_349109 [Lentinus tigrinus ALCF2SS1-7]
MASASAIRVRSPNPTNSPTYQATPSSWHTATEHWTRWRKLIDCTYLRYLRRVCTHHPHSCC